MILRLIVPADKANLSFLDDDGTILGGVSGEDFKPSKYNLGNLNEDYIQIDIDAAVGIILGWKPIKKPDVKKDLEKTYSSRDTSPLPIWFTGIEGSYRSLSVDNLNDLAQSMALYRNQDGELPF